VLEKNGQVLDVFGTTSCNPGEAWRSGGKTTKNVTLRRNPCINRGQTNGGGCTFSLNEWIAFPAGTVANLGVHTEGIPEVTIAGKNALCDALSIPLEVPTGFRTYRWSNGGTSSSIIVSSPGTYTVTVTSEEGCQAEASKRVNGQSPEICAEITEVEEVSCLPKEDGGFSVNASGGVGGFSYAWEGGSSNNAQIRGLGAGDYIVTVMDGNGCAIEKEVTIGGSTTISLNVAARGETCKDRGDGQIRLSSNGNNLRYSIDGINFQNDGFFADLLPGNYRAMVVDNSGCGNEERVTISGGTRFTLSLIHI